MSFHTAYLVLGTNLGNRYKNLSNARLEINEIPRTRIIKKVRFLNLRPTVLLNNHFFLILHWKLKQNFCHSNCLTIFNKLKKSLKEIKIHI